LRNFQNFKASNSKSEDSDAAELFLLYCKMVEVESKEIRAVDLEATQKALTSSSTATRTHHLRALHEKLTSSGS
jgi:hypothetical protein